MRKLNWRRWQDEHGCIGLSLNGQSWEPSRLTLARQARGLWRCEMAEQSGIPLKDLRGYERRDYSKPPPTVEHALRIAAFLNWPVAFFFEDEIELTPTDSISWVSGSRFLDAEIERDLANLTQQMRNNQVSTMDNQAQCLTCGWTGELPIENIDWFEATEECSEVEIRTCPACGSTDVEWVELSESS